MKIIFSLALLFSFVCNSYATPLIFNISKLVDKPEIVELGVVNTAKYKQIRIVIKVRSRDKNQDIDIAKNRFETAKTNHEKVYKDFQSKEIAKDDLVKAEQERLDAMSDLTNNIHYPAIGIFDVNNNEDVLILSFNDEETTKIIESPPDVLKIKAFGKGEYKISIYGE